MSRFIAALSIPTLAAWVLAVTAAGADDEPPPPPAAGEFDGKIVRVYFGESGTGQGAILENSILREIGGRTMLVGTYVESGQEGDWRGGLRTGVAWESVEMYFVMTPEQFDKMFRSL